MVDGWLFFLGGLLVSGFLGFWGILLCCISLVWILVGTIGGVWLLVLATALGCWWVGCYGGCLVVVLFWDEL